MSSFSALTVCEKSSESCGMADHRPALARKVEEWWALMAWCSAPYVIGVCISTLLSVSDVSLFLFMTWCTDGQSNHDSWEKWWWEGRLDNLKVRTTLLHIGRKLWGQLSLG